MWKRQKDLENMCIALEVTIKEDLSVQIWQMHQAIMGENATPVRGIMEKMPHPRAPGAAQGLEVKKGEQERRAE